MRKYWLFLIVLALILITFQCYAWIEYVVHLAGHQLRVILQSELISERLQKETIPPAERSALEATLRIRNFAEKQYGLAKSRSYRKYFDVGRKVLGWNITATPEFSLQPKEYNFGPIGRFTYLGFFSRTLAEKWVAELQNAGYDVHLSEIGGYSTLGWFDDPLYSSQLHWGEMGLARLLGHEIAHERLYFHDDTATSEAIASFIERVFAMDYAAETGLRWQPVHWQAAQKRLQQFQGMIEKTKKELEELYSSTLEPQEKRRRKKQIFAELKNKADALNRNYVLLPPLQLPPVAELNNAWLVQLRRYQPPSAALQGLLERCKKHGSGAKYQCWFAELEKLRRCSVEERARWLSGNSSDLPSCAG